MALLDGHSFFWSTDLCLQREVHCHLVFMLFEGRWLTSQPPSSTNKAEIVKQRRHPPPTCRDVNQGKSLIQWVRYCPYHEQMIEEMMGTTWHTNTWVFCDTLPVFFPENSHDLHLSQWTSNMSHVWSHVVPWIIASLGHLSQPRLRRRRWFARGIVVEYWLMDIGDNDRTIHGISIISGLLIIRWEY